MAHGEEATGLGGKVALVTGGRRGLGRAMALGLARAGARLAVSALSPDAGGLGPAVEALDSELFYLPCDLAKRDERGTLVDAVVEHYGQIDILVNCAGAQFRQPALEFDLEQWDMLISLMLSAVFELSQDAARVMMAQGGGKIINIASLLSFQGGWTVPAYTAAKHGVAGLTRALANEWAAHNINVNAIAPGYFDTEMCAALKADPVRGPEILARIPAGRWGDPEDLVGPLLFLAGEASRYVHGHVLVVDGGWLGR